MWDNAKKRSESGGKKKYLCYTSKTGDDESVKKNQPNIMQFGFFSPNTVLPYIARDIVSVSTWKTDSWGGVGTGFMKMKVMMKMTIKMKVKVGEQTRCA